MGERVGATNWFLFVSHLIREGEEAFDEREAHRLDASYLG